MIPIKFKQCNRVYGEGQKDYIPLPALAIDDDQGTVVTCWKPSFIERLQILFTGKLWLSMLNFHKPLTPVSLSSTQPFKD